MKANFCARSALFTTTKPATKSECPPKYLVALCNTMSAPNVNGL